MLALEPLLGNTTRIGVRKALLIFREVERMARELAEGQAIELSWIADGQFDLSDHDYVRIAYKKTCWYTVIAPLRIGVICGSQPGLLAPLEDELQPLIELGFLAGIASSAHALAIRPVFHPLSRVGPEKPKLGSDGITRWNASAASPPCGRGSVSGPITLRNSRTEPGQPCVRIRGSASGSGERTCIK